MNRDIYGARETNGLENGPEYHKQYDNAPTVDWTDPNLKTITRLRLLSDPGYPVWDVSYCHGVLKDGTLVHVSLPFSQIPKRGMKKFIIQEAKRDKVYAKALGIFDSISTLN